VAKAKSDSSKDDDNTLENDEGDLVLDQITIVTLSELSNTVDASSEDEDNGSRETSEESNHAPAKGLGPVGSPVSDHVVGEDGDEDNEDNNLENETSHGDINTNVAVGAGGHGTSGSLENEADDVEGDEDPVEKTGLEARERRIEEVDGLGESDVDGSGIEDGSDGKTDDLDHEGVEGEGIVVHHDTADVADNLRDAAEKHASHETPALPSETKIGVHEADETEENDKDNVGGQRRSVAVKTPVDRAVVEITGRVRAKGIVGVDGVVVRHVELLG
jgi:hypothetical protein